MRTLHEAAMRVPLKIWADIDSLEPEAIEQARHIASLPFTFHHAALMPDAHVGYGSPIGMVAGLQGYVCPNFVGVDIGCGMCAVKTPLTEAGSEVLKSVMGKIREAVPVGFNRQLSPQDMGLLPLALDCEVVDREWEKAKYQLGTLGGGNHFIEIQKGSDNFIWVMVHSGSRNLGKQIADHYNKLAVSLNERWYSSVPKAWELAFFPADSYEGIRYLAEMQFCVDFALANRLLMMNRIWDIFEGQTGGDWGALPEVVNIAHNYARLENHFGKNVMVHRKGATSARDGELGIIPGSQGSKSYIVKGKGNRDSFQSCSHGAGRKMGRKQAQRTLNLEEEKKLLDGMGVIHSLRETSDLDEAPGAYKDIDEVMANQADLVDVVVELTPLAVVKG